MPEVDPTWLRNLDKAISNWEKSIQFMQQNLTNNQAWVNANPGFAKSPNDYANSIPNAQKWLDYARTVRNSSDPGAVRAAIETSRNAWRGLQDPAAINALRQGGTAVVQQIAPAVGRSGTAIVQQIAPAVEAGLPQAEAVVPAVESVMPAVESVIPAVESAIPAVESVIPALEPLVPVIEQNAPVIVATTGAAVATATTAGEAAGGIGAVITGALEGAPGGPIGVAVGVSVTLVLIGGAWWVSHRKPSTPTTQDVAVVQSTAVPESTTSEPPTTETTVAQSTSTTLPLFEVTTEPSVNVTLTTLKSATSTTGVRNTTTSGSPATVTTTGSTTTSTTAPKSPATTAAGTVQVKVVSSMSCGDNDLATPDTNDLVTIDGAPIPFNPGDNTGRTTVTPGAHAAGGDGPVISVNFQRSGGAENKHVVGSSASFTFGQHQDGLDYVVAVRFRDPAC